MLIGLSVLPALQDRRPCSDCRSRARIPEEISRRSRAERRPARDRRLMDRVRIRVEFFFRSIGRQIAGRGQVNGPVGARGGSVDARHRPIDRISAAGGAGQISRRTRVVAARPASSARICNDLPLDSRENPRAWPQIGVGGGPGSFAAFSGRVEVVPGRIGVGRRGTTSPHKRRAGAGGGLPGRFWCARRLPTAFGRLAAQPARVERRRAPQTGEKGRRLSFSGVETSGSRSPFPGTDGTDRGGFSLFSI
jgi:hypothetical protein